jgi:PAS domain S-box-containing protein
VSPSPPAVLASLPVPVLVFDAKLGCVGGNAAWERLFGACESGTALDALLPEVRGDGVQRLHRGEAVELTKGSLKIVVSPLVENGHLRGGHIVATTTAVDLTLVESLRLEHERLSVTLRSIGDGVIATDVDGRVTLMNRAAEDRTGWSLDEARGRTATEVFRAYDELKPAVLLDPVREVLATRSSYGLHDHTVLVSRGGEQHPIAHSVAPVVDADGTLGGAVLVFRDMRARRKLEQELIRAGKLEVLGDLAARIAHEFNNVLTAVVGGLGIVERTLPPEASARRGLGLAEAGCRRAQELAKELLTFATGGAPLQDRVSLRDVVDRACEVALGDAPVPPEIDVAADIAVLADRAQLRQALQNLMRGAAARTRESGRVRITAHVEHVPLPESVPLPEGRYVRIEIDDEGPGLAPDEIARIFDPFYSDRVDAVGLGLAVAHSIVHQHGGFLTVAAVEGRGTVYTAHLPMAPAATSDPPRVDPVVPSTRRVLVMDDEELILALVEDVLQEYGYEVTTVRDGRAAVQAYRDTLQAGYRYDVVILDLTVPRGMGGEATMRELRLLDPTVRAVVSSGYSESAAMTRHGELGFAAVLPKPFDITQLLDVVGRLLGEPAARNQP